MLNDYDEDKITYYKELIPYLKEIQKILDEKNRGFVFATLPKDDNKVRDSKPLSCIRLRGETDEQVMIEFWAGLLTIIEAVSSRLPEDQRGLWREGFITFIKATAGICFPSVDVEKIN